MLLVITLLIITTVIFFLLSNRFENSIKNKPLTLRSTPLLSILIPSYRSSRTIGNTLRSIRDSDYPKREIIVVNDSPGDGTAEIARSYGARVLENSIRLGKGPALNLAAGKARGDFLLVLDSDTCLEPATLTKLMASYQSYESRGERVGIVAPRYMARNRSNIFSKFSDMEQALHQSLLKVQMHFKSILSIRGCCLLINRQAFQEAGGFSRTILEDGDFTAKAIKSGYRIKYEPRALVKTREPSSLRSLLKAKMRYGRGTLYCLLRHKKPYMASIQSAVCFYPALIIALAFLALLVFQDPFSFAAILIFLAPLSITMGTTSMISFAAIVSVVAVFLGVGAAVSATVKKLSLFNTTLPFFLVFVPILTFAYFRGAFSGIADKFRGREEMDFRNW
jgi:cellulose synthase/poly-beta-1,6-N-acetylglucosamine synthase-like glycosyltransferase